MSKKNEDILSNIKEINNETLVNDKELNSETAEELTEKYKQKLLETDNTGAIEEVSNQEIDQKNLSEDIQYYGERNKWKLYSQLVNIFNERAKSDNNAKGDYSKILIIMLGLQLAAMDGIFILKGLDVLQFEDTTFNIFITATIAEVFTLVTIIVRYLFKDNLTELVKNILNNEDKKNKKD